MPRPPSKRAAARPGRATDGSLLADNRRTFKKVIRVVSKLFFSATTRQAANGAAATAVCWLIACLDLTLPLLLLQTVLEVGRFFLRLDDDDSKEGRKTTATFRSFKHCRHAVIQGERERERERERDH